MPFSRRPFPFDTVLLGELLLGAFLITAAPPARAGGDDDEDEEYQGRISAGQLMEAIDDHARYRSELFFGNQDAPDPVLFRGGRGGDRYGNFDDPEKARRMLAEEWLERLEQRLNQKSKEWNPFRDEDEGRKRDGNGDRNRKRDRDRDEAWRSSGPKLLFGLEDPTPDPVVIGESWKSRFRMSLVRGLEYRQEWPAGGGDRKLRMRVYGPIVPGGPGLGLQLKGHLLDHRFRLNAYGAEKEFGLTMDLEF